MFQNKDGDDENKLKVRKNQRGMVFVEGAVVKPANSAAELYALFETGSSGRYEWEDSCL
jgi:hypothetical protein